VSTVSLEVEGLSYRGWKRVLVRRSIESISGYFQLDTTDRWAGQKTPWPIQQGQKCKVSVDDTPLITGYVDSRSLSYDSSSHTIALAGRDWTGSLVDSSAQLGKWEFKNLDLLKFAKKICEQFGREDSVFIEPTLVSPIFAKLSVSPGETAFEAIDKVARLAGLLPISDGQGRLTFSRAGTSICETDLAEGVNILSASAQYDSTERFRTYVVLGQSNGSDASHGAAVASIKGFAEDPTVARADRTLLIRPEGNVTPEYAKRRAQFEATARLARSCSVTITVQGWTQPNGKPWPLNAFVNVTSAALDMANSTQMVIATIENTLDQDSGSLTRMTLRPAAAWNPEPVLPKAPKKAPWEELKGL
jgi:prophage tail gpP-like protein